MQENCLESLPAEFSACTKLEVLNVTGNKLTSLAPISGMTGMKSILAGQNQVRPPAPAS